MLFIFLYKKINLNKIKKIMQRKNYLRYNKKKIKERKNNNIKYIDF
jgi:hypothetical protein